MDPTHFVWTGGPEIVQIGPFVLRWYGLLFACGFIAGYVIMQRIFRREGKPEADLEWLLLYMVAGTILGARLGHVLFYEPAYYFERPWLIPMVWRGGLASHGGAIGIFTALYLYARRRPGQPYLWLLDRIAIPTALAGAFIRTGNFFNSEILGEPADVPWAVVFARVDLVPRHPAMLYEAAAYLLIFGVLAVTYRRFGPKVPRGLLVGLFLALVFTARFFVEFVKMQQASFDSGALQMGQWLSLPMIAAGLVLMWRATAGRPGEGARS